MTPDNNAIDHITIIGVGLLFPLMNRKPHRLIHTINELRINITTKILFITLLLLIKGRIDPFLLGYLYFLRGCLASVISDLCIGPLSCR